MTIEYCQRRLQLYLILLQSSAVLTVAGFIYVLAIAYSKVLAISTFILLCCSIVLCIIYKLLENELVLEVSYLIEILDYEDIVDLACKYRFKIKGNSIIVCNKFLNISKSDM